jgi:Flp pilus assembly secretin CpaC
MLARLGACALSLVLLPPTSVSRAADKTVTLALGSGSVFTLQRPFEAVLVGDENVIDVHTKDERSVILQALKIGTSNVVFVDARRVAIAKIRVVVCEAKT